MAGGGQHLVYPARVIDELPTGLIDWAGPFGGVVLLWWSWVREWWIPGRTYKREIEALTKDRDYYRSRLLESLGLTELAIETAKEAVA